MRAPLSFNKLSLNPSTLLLQYCYYQQTPKKFLSEKSGKLKKINGRNSYCCPNTSFFLQKSMPLIISAFQPHKNNSTYSTTLLSPKQGSNTYRKFEVIKWFKKHHSNRTSRSSYRLPIGKNF